MRRSGVRARRVKLMASSSRTSAWTSLSNMSDEELRQYVYGNENEELDS